jgi:hypothetical protein
MKHIPVTNVFLETGHIFLDSLFRISFQKWEKGKQTLLGGGAIGLKFNTARKHGLCSRRILETRT